MFLGAFRGNVWIARDSNGNRYSGWLSDPEILWNLEKISFLKQLHNLAQSISGQWVTKFFQDGSPFSYDFAERQFGKANLKSTLPQKFYTGSNDAKYTKTDNQSNATHTLEVKQSSQGKFSVVQLHEGLVSGLPNAGYYIAG